MKDLTIKDIFKTLSIIGLFALMSCQQISQEKEKRINAVPKSAFLVIEADDMGDAFQNLSENSLWKTINDEKSIEVISTQLKALNSFLKKNEVEVDDDKLLLSVHKTGSNSFDYLIYLNEGDIDNYFFEKIVKYKKSTKKYDGADIYKYSLPGIDVPVFVCKYKGVLVLSRNIILVENSIRQLNSGVSLMDNQDFNSLYNATNPKEDFNILINISKLDIVSSWSSQKELVSWTKKFSDWVELEVSPEKEEVFMSGIVSTNDSIGHFLGVFKNQKARAITIDELLPSATSFSISFGIDTFSKYYQSYTNYLRKNGKIQQFEIKQKSFKIDRHKLFDSWVEDQFLIASIKSNKAEINYNDLVLIKSKDEALALEALQLVSDKSVIDFRRYAIRKFNKSNVLSSYFGGFLDKINKPYYTVIDDVVVFSDNLKTVKEVISDYLDGRSLSNYNHFKDLKSDLSDESNILFYFKNPDFVESIGDVFPDLKKVISRNSKVLSKYKSGGIQFSYDGKNAFVYILLKQSSKEENEVKPLWDLDFEKELYDKIFTLYNHKTKKKEVAVQDKDNVLYLVSTSGKILWKKQLDSKILGEIKQVDLYKNKRFQMVFNTEKYLYLIDRNSKKLPGYPIKLRWKSTSGVGVFDYSKMRDYRLLVPMGKHLVMYNGKGDVVKGFKKNKVKGTINKAPQHFRVKGKDYIIVSTTSNIYVLDRRGKDKFKVSEKHTLGRNPFYVSEASTLSKSSFVTTTKEGELLNVFMNGVIDVTKVEGFDENTYYEKLNGDVVSLSENELKWTNNKSAGVLDIEGGDFCKPQVFKIGNSGYVMFGSKSINKVFLYDADMNLQKGFPIYGQTVGQPTDYNKDGIIEFPVVVSQGKGNLKMYSVN